MLTNVLRRMKVLKVFERNDYYAAYFLNDLSPYGRKQYTEEENNPYLLRSVTLRRDNDVIVSVKG
jgi:hypothetical protein